MAKSSNQLPLLDNPFATDIFADDAIGYQRSGDVLRITLVSVKTDHSKNPGVEKAVVSNRLVMPHGGVESLHRLLGKYLEAAKAQRHKLQ